MHATSSEVPLIVLDYTLIKFETAGEGLSGCNIMSGCRENKEIPINHPEVSIQKKFTGA